MASVKILVVDDCEEIREFCRLSLKDRYDVVMAGNGAEAQEQLKKQRFDLIVLDIYLPKMDGLTLAENIKSDPEYKEIPIILMTGLTEGSELPAGFWKIGTPADSFLCKPIDRWQLVHEVEKVLARIRGMHKKKKISGGGYL